MLGYVKISVNINLEVLGWLNIGILFLWSLQTVWVSAQSVTISGYVEDSTSSERIPGASVSIPERQSGTITNQYGFYSLTTKASSIRLLTSHVGYKPVWNFLELNKDTTLILTLEPKIVRMKDIEVVAHEESSLDEIQMSRHEIPLEEIKTLPVLLGEIDIQKTLQLLPSVQSGIEGSSGLYVRGGRADQNLILLDGLPLYNPSHLFGFFSVFNSSAMKRVEFIKGGFPARYGGRLSSIVNYTMKEGNRKRLEGEGGIGLISSRIMLHGPILKNRTSFLIAGRRSYLDQLIRPFQWGRKRYGAAFYDINVKVNHIFPRGSRIYLSGYAGRDGFYYEDNPRQKLLYRTKYNLGWYNRLASLRWNKVLGDKLFANSLIGITQYRFASNTYSLDTPEDNISTEFDRSWYSEIVDWTGKIDFEYIPNTRHYVRFGLEGILHRFNPGTTHTRLNQSDRLPLNLLQTPAGALRSWQGAFYAEDDIQLHRTLRLSAGIRLGIYSANGSHFRSIEPRLGINIQVGERTALKASFAQSKQYVHLLGGGGLAFPTDLWIPAMDRIPPQSGYQVATGIRQTYQDGLYTVSVEGYLKRMKGHIEYKVGSNRFRAALLDWPDLVTIGTGKSHGAELFIQKRKGQLTGWIGYTWAQTTRRFASLNQGQSFPDGYDRRHDISVVMQYRFSRTRILSVVWIYGSGYPVWVPAGRYVGSGGFGLNPEYTYPNHLVEPGPVNTARAPNYHRADISMQFRKERYWGGRTISVGLYNVYNRKNPMFVYPKREATGQSIISFRQLSLLQLIPAISWEWHF